MAATMSRKTRDEYLEKMRERYARWRGKQARSQLLTEFCEVTGHERKYATKLLGRRRRPALGQAVRGRCQWESSGVVARRPWRHCSGTGDGVHGVKED